MVATATTGTTRGTVTAVTADTAIDIGRTGSAVLGSTAGTARAGGGCRSTLTVTARDIGVAVRTGHAAAEATRYRGSCSVVSGTAATTGHEDTVGDIVAAEAHVGSTATACARIVV